VLTLSPSCNGRKTNVQGETHILVQKMDSEENRHNESERSFPVDFSWFEKKNFSSITIGKKWLCQWSWVRPKVKPKTLGKVFYYMDLLPCKITHKWFIIQTQVNSSEGKAKSYTYSIIQPCLSTDKFGEKWEKHTVTKRYRFVRPDRNRLRKSITYWQGS